ncbi:hypothetical protein C8F01DRAFT_1112996 [Mycena amicta]|nr:hypothetical protein C8F01DRAFT_1112996 [Mycena amicta]
MPVENDLPLEIIELIVDELPDDASLRSCSLVASIFRLPCQKRLLCSFQLSYHTGLWGRWRTYAEAAAILDAYPHFAGYVTTVYMHFPEMRTDWADNEVAAQSVLRRLTLVRTAEITGELGATTDFAAIAQVLDRVLDTLRVHGTMTRLVLHQFHELPLDVIRRVLISAPSLAFLSTTVVNTSSIPSASGFLPGSRKRIQTLRIGGNQNIAALLLLPEFASYTSSLRELSFDIEGHLRESNFALCASAAQTLEYIAISFLYHTLSHDASNFLPAQLPALRQLAITFFTHHSESGNANDWLPLSFLISVLSTSRAPALNHITIRLSTRTQNISPNQYAHIFRPDLLRELDNVLVGHPALRQIHCSVQFSPDRDPTRLDTFSSALHCALPKSSAKGLLVITLASV